MKKISINQRFIFKSIFASQYTFKFCDKNKLSADEKYWEEFIKRKTEQREIQLQGTDFRRNSLYDFKYSLSHFIKSEEFINCIEDLEKNSSPNYVFIDIRSEFEISDFRLPSRTKKQAFLPILYREAHEVLEYNIEDFPKDKFLIIFDENEILARKVWFFLNYEGYKAIYLSGGIFELKLVLKDKKF